MCFWKNGCNFYPISEAMLTSCVSQCITLQFKVWVYIASIPYHEKIYERIKRMKEYNRKKFPVFHSESLFLRAKSRRRMYGRRSELAQGSIFVVLSSADLDVFENTTPMPNTIDATSSLLKNLPPPPPRAHTSIFKNAETFFQSWKSIIDAENFSSKNIQSLKSLNE